MEFRSYNQELGIANILFQRIFSNIQIERTSADGSKYLVPVTCVLGQRSRILKSLENPERKGNMKVPMIVINRTGYTRNGERLNDMHNEIKYELNSYTRKYQIMTPVPVDISYDVSIIAKYPSDIDKIASNFIVFFNSDIYVSCHHPKFIGIKMNNQIIMQDSVSEDHSDEIDGSTDDLITATFQFTFKTFLFAGTTPLNITKPTILSTYLSTVLSNVVVEIQPNEIDKFQELHPNSSVSVYEPTYIQTQVSTEIPNPNISSSIYDDIPVINRIDLGIYPIDKKQTNMTGYMQSVDNEVFTSHQHIDISGYISSEQYIMPKPTIISNNDLDSLPLSIYNNSISTVNDYYDYVTNKCTFEPYVDRLYWIIDPGSTYEFPNNTKLMRD